MAGRDTKTPFRNTFTTGAKAQKELRETLEAELGKRLKADNILNPEDVYGDYDFNRVLFTTLGGQARPITVDDLAQFRYIAKNLGKKYKGGIKPKQVIDASLPADRERAHKEITAAIPVTHRGGRIQFQTNSGPNSNVTRHQLVVELLNYDAAVASPQPANKVVKAMLDGPVKLECDCGRWRFWFRYLASIGKYNAGRAESGYPKIRNPQLHGVACKHILRVMALLSQSPTFKNYAIRMIEQGREALEKKRKVVRIKDMEEFREKLRKESWRQRAVQTTEEKQAKRAGISVTELRARNEAKFAAQRAKKAQMKAAKQKAQPTQAQFVKQLMTMGFTQDQALAAFKAAQAAAK